MPPGRRRGSCGRSGSPHPPDPLLFAAGCEAFIPRDQPRVQEAPERRLRTPIRPFRHFVRETVEGFRWVWERTGMRDFMILASLVSFLGMPVVVLFPFDVS